MRPDIFLATIGRGSNGSNALEVTEDRAAVTAESQDNIINRVNNVSQYGPSWHYVPGIGVAGTAYAEVPGSATGDLAFSRASSKTRTNAAGVVETIGNNVPPHDYRNADGSLSTFPRLLLEPQRTNSIRNSSMVGAVAGSPGTLPTNWTSLLNGLTQTIVGTGTQNGLNYIDLRFSGTASGTVIYIRPETVTNIAAATGQTWTNSVYLRAISSAPNALRLISEERTSAGVYVTEGSTSDFSITSSLAQYTFTRTLNGGATVGAVNPIIRLNLTNGAAYDFTIRIAAPQMELGAYATTWVPTTTAAVTRLADAASKTGVSSLIGQTEGTLFLDFVNRNYLNTGLLTQFTISGGDATNRCRIFIENGLLQSVVRVAGVDVAAFSSGAPTANAQFKVALAYKQNDFVMYVNGTQIGTDTSGNVPACSRIGFDNGGGFIGNDQYINQAALFTTRLTNAQLAQLTTL